PPVGERESEKSGVGRVAPGGAVARGAEWALRECAQPEGLRFTKRRVSKPLAPLLPPATGPVRLAREDSGTTRVDLTERARYSAGGLTLGPRRFYGQGRPAWFPSRSRGRRRHVPGGSPRLRAGEAHHHVLERAHRRRRQGDGRAHRSVPQGHRRAR